MSITNFTMTNLKTVHYNAKHAFEHLYEHISEYGEDFASTKALFDVGITILHPDQNRIDTPWRRWNKVYADREWNWYLSGNPSAVEIAKKAPIWGHMMDEDGNVRSNYGWQWERNNQLDKVIDMLRDNPNTRQAAISIYDGKEIDTYSRDTPCTYAVQFTVRANLLYMSVYMRSNDLWYGFCNDQYCFSNLFNLVAEQTGYETGYYYHHVHNMHIYNDFLGRNKQT